MADANRYLRIENYRQYQHYKERRPPWVKQHRDFWNNYDMSTQKTSTRLLALFLISYASEFENELIPYNVSELSRRSSLNRVAVEYGIANLVKASFLAITDGKGASKPLARRKQNASPLVQRERKRREANASLREGPEKSERPRDLLWDALVGEVGTEPSTRSERGMWNAALKQLREVEATPDELRRRCKAFQKRWPELTLTPTALVKWWGSLGGAAELSKAERDERWLQTLKERGVA